MTAFNPKNNSIYCFNGDYVSHMVHGVDFGCRFAVVLFINTPQTDLDVAMGDGKFFVLEFKPGLEFDPGS
jgi:hypothetical protein